MTHFLYIIEHTEGEEDQYLHGPYKTEAARVSAAKQIEQENEGVDLAFIGISKKTGRVKWFDRPKQMQP